MDKPDSISLHWEMLSAPVPTDYEKQSICHNGTKRKNVKIGYNNKYLDNGRSHMTWREECND
jgi:hypothetical protein